MNAKDFSAVLARVHQIAKKFGGNLVPARELERSDREILVEMRWLQEIIRGWYLFTRPNLLPGESSAWYINFWTFVQIYLREGYGNHYCLSAETSLDLHIGSTTIPKQVIAIVEKQGAGKPVQLPFDTSILVYSDANGLPSERTTVRDLQVMTLALALCKVSPTYFLKNPREAEIALRTIQNIEELIQILLTHRFVRAADRILGAYEHLGEMQKAETILRALRMGGMSPNPINPFTTPPVLMHSIRSPYQAQVYSHWERFRSTVIEYFSASPGMAKDKRRAIEEINDLYAKDAYNSLSIEGYRVDPELIERVHRSDWNPDVIGEDRTLKDTLAARGYFETFVEVKKAIVEILDGESSGKVLEKNLPIWFQKLFDPSRQAGILKPHELLGYRRHQVYIRNSRHVPFPQEALADAMDAFFDCLKKEPHPAVRAILGHFIFVYIHPFMDGNGRLGRFIMNAMLASGGYPWTIIEMKNRSRYFEALEKVSIDNDIQPFTLFVKDEMQNSHANIK